VIDLEVVPPEAMVDEKCLKIISFWIEAGDCYTYLSGKMFMLDPFRSLQTNLISNYAAPTENLTILLITRFRTGRTIEHSTPQTQLSCFAMIGNQNSGHSMLGLKEGVAWKRCVEQFLDYIGIGIDFTTLIYVLSWATS